VVEFEATLPTLIADKDGVLCRSMQKTKVRVFDANGPAMLYEMGIPVVESGDKFDIDVSQKVPLNMDRDTRISEGGACSRPESYPRDAEPRGHDPDLGA